MAFPADYSAYRTKQKLNKMYILHNRVYITVYIMKIIVYIQHKIVYILHNIAYLLQKIVCILQKKLSCITYVIISRTTYCMLNMEYILSSHLCRIKLKYLTLDRWEL